MTGAKSLDVLSQAAEIIYPCLEEFRKKNLKASNMAIAQI